MTRDELREKYESYTAQRISPLVLKKLKEKKEKK
jgi:hypothetical protein